MKEIKKKTERKIDRDNAREASKVRNKRQKRNSTQGKKKLMKG